MAHVAVGQRDARFGPTTTSAGRVVDLSRKSVVLPVTVSVIGFAVAAEHRDRDTATLHASVALGGLKAIANASGWTTIVN